MTSHNIIHYRKYIHVHDFCPHCKCKLSLVWPRRSCRPIRWGWFLRLILRCGCWCRSSVYRVSDICRFAVVCNINMAYILFIRLRGMIVTVLVSAVSRSIMLYTQTPHHQEYCQTSDDDSWYQGEEEGHSHSSCH